MWHHPQPRVPRICGDLAPTRTRLNCENKRKEKKHVSKVSKCRISTLRVIYFRVFAVDSVVVGWCFWSGFWVLTPHVEEEWVMEIPTVMDGMLKNSLVLHDDRSSRNSNSSSGEKSKSKSSNQILHESYIETSFKPWFQSSYGSQHPEYEVQSITSAIKSSTQRKMVNFPALWLSDPL